MTLHCINSGSVGNNYTLKADDSKMLILDLGVPQNDILKAIGFKLTDVEACLVSHSHF
jgi:glyoxylase-like metal-dependent hydrolase (beta-lactamase superfamily II)